MGRSGPKEGSRQVYEFSDSAILEKIGFFTFGKCETPLHLTMLEMCSVLYLVISLLIGQYIWALIPIVGKMRKGNV